MIFSNFSILYCRTCWLSRAPKEVSL